MRVKPDPIRSDQAINNFIRAQTKPYPGAWTIIDGHKVTIWDAEITKINE